MKKNLIDIKTLWLIFTRSSDHVRPDPMLDAFGKLAAFINKVASQKFNCFCNFRLRHRIRQRITTMIRVSDKVATAKVIHLRLQVRTFLSFLISELTICSCPPKAAVMRGDTPSSFVRNFAPFRKRVRKISTLFDSAAS